MFTLRYDSCKLLKNKGNGNQQVTHITIDLRALLYTVSLACVHVSTYFKGSITLKSH